MTKEGKVTVAVLRENYVGFSKVRWIELIEVPEGFTVSDIERRLMVYKNDKSFVAWTTRLRDWLVVLQ